MSVWALLICHDSMILILKQLMQMRRVPLYWSIQTITELVWKQFRSTLEHTDNNRPGLETVPLYTGTYRPSQSWSGNRVTLFTEHTDHHRAGLETELLSLLEHTDHHRAGLATVPLYIGAYRHHRKQLKHRPSKQFGHKRVLNVYC